VKAQYEPTVSAATVAHPGPARWPITASAIANSTAMGITLKRSMFKTCVSDCVARETMTLRAPGFAETR